MLTLTRKCREILVVSDAAGFDILVKVVVLEIKKGKVRLGFDAAGDVPVERFEDWERLRRSSRVEALCNEHCDDEDRDEEPCDECYGIDAEPEPKAIRLQDIGGKG